ncbi:hypothetical protein CBR_g11890 [Chara braunii]|uniref:Kinesin motor domain-containing protein n=1 Tax=Chara braunii TaxID=69332 RepID=A0A388JSB0_CHABU|nr:hypothetical protein CBR_g11890 [Chara braunii]|eukprot:GBG60665.1 hypothetical protein CBR_g11890 [Chara braunii]
MCIRDRRREEGGGRREEGGGSREEEAINLVDMMFFPPSPNSAPAEGCAHTSSGSAVMMASSAVDDSSAVRVAVRARPLIAKEIMEKCKECVTFFPTENQVLIGKDRRFTFDHVFGPDNTQETVYVACVKPLVESCMAGYNATVLAYGQTGSGKTHTMGSGNNTAVLEEELGILPRVIRQLFESVEEKKAQAEFLVRCAFVEIYNEDIKDLLHPDTPNKSIAIREDANGDIILAGVRDVVVTNYDDMIRQNRPARAYSARALGCGWRSGLGAFLALSATPQWFIWDFAHAGFRLGLSPMGYDIGLVKRRCRDHGQQAAA